MIRKFRRSHERERSGARRFETELPPTHPRASEKNTSSSVATPDTARRLSPVTTGELVAIDDGAFSERSCVLESSVGGHDYRIRYCEIENGSRVGDLS
ncbi:MAG: hypothetical protein IPK60_16810 [Sandaracinaceae bacterium]|nr:hypothetical protein [Sandaracinaceae bacterium]